MQQNHKLIIAATIVATAAVSAYYLGVRPLPWAKNDYAALAAAAVGAALVAAEALLFWPQR
jgi:hypothetical protein